jgi:hypothetical protein
MAKSRRQNAPRDRKRGLKFPQPPCTPEPPKTPPPPRPSGPTDTLWPDPLRNVKLGKKKK